MPLRLEIKRKFLMRSDRVKCVDLHPSEPWILANLYSGNIYIWNHQTGQLVKSFEVTELPVRCSKFVVRKQWIAAGSDDMFIRVYNYNTSELIKAFEAHTDYIRCIAVHPTLPYLLTSSDDMLIKLWDWDKGFACTQIFESHSHYVMQVAFNPKDTNTFASASLDRTIKVWSIGQPTANFTLEGHEKGVNCVDYFSGGDRPYLISGADDKLVKIWDYQTKSCVQTLEGHTHNISSVCFHPELPVIITGSEDGTLRIWHSTTYRLENTLNYGLERVWSVGVLKGSNNVTVGYDEGTVLFKIGREEPVASMDASGKIIWARHNEIQTVNVKAVPSDFEVTDGERLPLAVKELGSCDLYPQALQHNPNGRFVVVCGDGEYVIYTALAWRNKSFGTALDFAWATDANDYAVRESASHVTLYKNFQKKNSFRPHFAAEAVYGGALLSMRSTDFICFYDWAECTVVRRIDVAVKAVHWNDSGELVCLTTDSSFYILKLNRDAVSQYLASGGAQGGDPNEDEGCEEAFDLLYEISETVRTGLWVGDCFIYNNADWRLNYCVGGEVTTICHLDRPMYLLGYLAAQNRVYLIDKEFSIISFTLLLSLIEYKTLVLHGEMEAAEELLPSIPQDQHNNVARFLEQRGAVAEALRVATEPDYKFDLAIQLGELSLARQIATEVDSEPKWKQLGELALQTGDMALARTCLTSASDLSGLLLLHSAAGDAAGLADVAEKAKATGKHNVAFLCLFLLKRLEECVDLLCSAGRIPEAAFFARTYMPSKASETVGLWRDDLQKVNRKAAEALADPAEYANLFPDFDLALQAEELFKQRRGAKVPASAFPQHEGSQAADPIAELKGQGGAGAMEVEEPEAADEGGAGMDEAEAAGAGDEGEAEKEDEALFGEDDGDEEMEAGGDGDAPLDDDWGLEGDGEEEA